MKKVLQTASKYIFAGFGIAVLALLMSLTYSALTRIFPDSLINRIWGLVMFDIAAMCWAIAFVFTSESTGQYATAAIGFITGFVGTLGMVSAEVILSSGQIQAGDIAQYMVYGFIIVTALHAGLLYAHEATAPDIHEKINVGVARGEIVTEAITQATKTLDEGKAELAQSIQRDIVSKAKRDLGLIPVNGTPFETKHYEQTLSQAGWIGVEDKEKKNFYVNMPPQEFEELQNELAKKGYTNFTLKTKDKPTSADAPFPVG